MTLKKKFNCKELTIGSWITIGSVDIAEIMARAGYDWLTIDMEHSAITLDIAQNLIRVIELNNVTPLVRVIYNDPVYIKSVMDAGAHGVIVPMVNTKDDAENAVSAVKYPPQGLRGVGLARAQKYGADFDGYKVWNECESIVIVQIEHIKAVENLKDIINVDGVDAFIVGPYDLSGSLGVPGQFNHPAFKEALSHVKDVASQSNAISGFHVIQPDVVALKEKIHEGYKFLAHSLDILYLGNVCRKSIDNIRSYL